MNVLALALLPNETVRAVGRHVLDVLSTGNRGVQLAGCERKGPTVEGRDASVPSLRRDGKREWENDEPEVLGLNPPMVRSSGPPEVLLEVLE